MWKKLFIVTLLFILQGVVVYNFAHRSNYSVLMLGQTVAVSDAAKWYISDSQLKTISATMGLDLSIDETAQVVTISKEESSVESVNTTLKPLVKEGKTEVREKDLYGTWVTKLEDKAHGYVFLETDSYGPYTVVKTIGDIDDMEGLNDITLFGHYHITESNTLILNFRTQSDGTSSDLAVVEQSEVWQVDQSDTMLTMRQDGRVLSMVKPEFERE